MARMRSDQDRGMQLKRMLDQVYGDADGDEQYQVPASAPPGARDKYDAQINGAMIGNDSESEDEIENGPPQPAGPRDTMASGEEMVPVPKSIVKNVMAAMMRAGSRNSIGKSMGADGSGDTGFPHNRSMSEEPILPKESLPRGYQEDDTESPRRRRA